jgi:CRP-like cAMP-binding protein
MAITADIVRSSYLLSGLTPEQQEKVLALAEERGFDGGAQLVRQFAKDNDILILIEGKARVNSFSGDLIAEPGPGSVIGEMSLIDDKPRSATVVAVGKVLAAVIPNAKLWSLMEAEPAIGKQIILNLARILTERLRRANIDTDNAPGRA